MIEHTVLLDVGEIIELFLLKEQAVFGGLRRPLLREEFVDILQIKITFDFGHKRRLYLL